MQLLGLSLFASKGLNDVHRRAYNTTVTGESLNALEIATEGGRNLSQHAISQVAASIIRPSAESEGVAGIVNGWQNPRFRFILKMKETESNGTSNIAYYIGYTDYSEGSYTTGAGGHVHIDPQLQFHVTSVHRVRDMLGIVNGNFQTAKVTNRGAHQLLFGYDASTLQNNAKTTYLMRPSDVFSSQDTYSAMQRYGLIGPDIVVEDNTTNLVGGGNQSSRQNNAPGTYLFNTLKAYSYATAATEGFGDDVISFTREATAHTKDGTLFYDPFFSAMSSFNMNIRTRGQFAYNELARAYTYVDDVTTLYQPNDLQRMMANRTGHAQNFLWDNTNTEGWQGSNMETVSAALLANAVPSIMLDNLGADARFSLTNMTTDGTIARQLFNFTPIDQCLDAPTMFNRTLDRIEQELIPTISMNNAIQFYILIDTSIYGDTMVTISLNGGPQVPYVMPTFADNVASPILTNDHRRFAAVTHDIFSVAQSLLDKKPIGIIQQATQQDIRQAAQQQSIQQPTQLGNFY